jgi:hypothetical protein
MHAIRAASAGLSTICKKQLTTKKGGRQMNPKARAVQGEQSSVIAPSPVACSIETFCP